MDEAAGSLVGAASVAGEAVDEDTGALVWLPQEQETLWMRMLLLWWGLPQGQEKLLKGHRCPVGDCVRGRRSSG